MKLNCTYLLSWSSIATNLGNHSKTFQIGLTRMDKLIAGIIHSNRNYKCSKTRKSSCVCPLDISLLQLFEKNRLLFTSWIAFNPLEPLRRSLSRRIQHNWPFLDVLYFPCSRMRSSLNRFILTSVFFWVYTK